MALTRPARNRFIQTQRFVVSTREASLAWDPRGSQQKPWIPKPGSCTLSDCSGRWSRSVARGSKGFGGTAGTDRSKAGRGFGSKAGKKIGSQARKQEKTGQSFDTDCVLKHVYESVFGGVDPPEELILESTTKQKGSRSVGVFRVRTGDGAFAENNAIYYDTKGAPNVRVMHGFDGKDKVWSWESNDQQRFEEDLDEKEATILQYWSLNTLYALPRIRSKIDVEALSPEAAKGHGTQKDEVCLALRLRRSEFPGVEGCVTAYQFINTTTWLPSVIITDYCGRNHVVNLSGWRLSEAMPAVVLPTVNRAAEIGKREYQTKLWSARPRQDFGYVVPGGPSNPRVSTLKAILPEPLPQEAPADIRAECPGKTTWKPDAENPYIGPSMGYNDTFFDPEAKNELELDVNAFGQMLVPARINDMDLGFWVLDTGASTNLMAGWAAKELGLFMFGEDNVSVVGGISNTAYVQVETFTVGPMTTKNLVFAVMDFPRDGPKFAGILGFDFFSRAIIEFQVIDRGGALGFNKRSAFIYNPRSDIDKMRVDIGSAAGNLVYSQLRFVSRNALVEATVKGECASPPSRNLMLLDLAGGSTDLVFNVKKAIDTGVTASDGSNVNVVNRSMFGLGGKSMQAVETQIAYVDVGGVRFDRHGIKASLINSRVDISSKQNGVLCMRLFDNCRIVIDYTRKRFGIGRL